MSKDETPPSGTQPTTPPFIPTTPEPESQEAQPSKLILEAQLQVKSDSVSALTSTDRENTTTQGTNEKEREWNLLGIFKSREKSTHSTSSSQDHHNQSRKQTNTSWAGRIIIGAAMCIAAGGLVLLLQKIKTQASDKTQPATNAPTPTNLVPTSTLATNKLLAVWYLRDHMSSDDQSDRISDDVPWPFESQQKVRIEVKYAPFTLLPELKFQLKETQRLQSEFRSDAFGDGDVVTVNGASRGGNADGKQAFYVVFAHLPQGQENLLKRWTTIEIKAFKVE